jgi:hypothetical protein
MKYILIISLLFFSAETNAQFGKRLKDRAKETAERKANQKADEAFNKGVDKIDSVITGKKRDKTNNSKTETETVGSTSDNSNTSNNKPGNGAVETTYKEVTIKTNIRCETGKKKIETLLQETDDVSNATIDTETGIVYVSFESQNVAAKVVELIRKNGFEADGKKPLTAVANPCR